MRRSGLLFFLVLLFALPVFSQKILQIERFGSPRTTKFYIGSKITYRLKNDEIWYRGEIEDLLLDQQLIAFEDRYVKLEQIEAFRFSQSWTKPLSVSLYTFGLAWSGFSLVGNLTDQNPSTSYSSGDAILTGASLATGFALQKLFGRKTVKFGERRRLRLLDITFYAQ